MPGVTSLYARKATESMLLARFFICSALLFAVVGAGEHTVAQTAPQAAPQTKPSNSAPPTKKADPRAKKEPGNKATLGNGKSKAGDPAAPGPRPKRAVQPDAKPSPSVDACAPRIDAALIRMQKRWAQRTSHLFAEIQKLRSRPASCPAVSGGTAGGSPPANSDGGSGGGRRNQDPSLTHVVAARQAVPCGLIDVNGRPGERTRITGLVPTKSSWNRLKSVVSSRFPKSTILSVAIVGYAGCLKAASHKWAAVFPNSSGKRRTSVAQYEIIYGKWMRQIVKRLPNVLNRRACQSLAEATLFDFETLAKVTRGGDTVSFWVNHRVRLAICRVRVSRDGIRVTVDRFFTRQRHLSRRGALLVLDRKKK